MNSKGSSRNPIARQKDFSEVLQQIQRSRQKVLAQINATYFERSAIEAKLSPVVRELHPSIGSTFKDSYVLEFLGLPPEHSESHLQKALVQHMKVFILELGGDFIFMGENGFVA
jgi:predicted nuclease of restriction endonuclease-like (RecB) superfamily